MARTFFSQGGAGDGQGGPAIAVDPQIDVDWLSRIGQKGQLHQLRNEKRDRQGNILYHPQRYGADIYYRPTSCIGQAAAQPDDEFADHRRQINPDLYFAISKQVAMDYR